MTSSSTLTIDTEFGERDIYGQCHPIETDELIDARLKELDEELEKVKKGESWLQAKAKCPDLVGRDFLLMFLRCRKFQAESAAKRIVTYWDHRIEIFGQDRAFLPMTLNGALQDDDVALQMGMAQLVGTKDSTGRTIFLFDPAKQDRTLYSRKSMARVFWYVIHAALECDDAQQKGVIFISYAKDVKFSQFDRGLIGILGPSIKGSLPIRLAAMHICYPPTFFNIVFSVISFFLGEKLRKRVRNHGSTNVPDKLAEFGLTADILPVQLDGTVNMDLSKWVVERKTAGK